MEIVIIYREENMVRCSQWVETFMSVSFLAMLKSVMSQLVISNGYKTNKNKTKQTNKQTKKPTN